jgi:hypothetical protein
MRTPLLAALLCLSAAALTAQSTAPDSDHDGLSDADEAALLQQFAPRIMVSSADCSHLPAHFAPLAAAPTPDADDGTLYGQATLRTDHAGQVELHFYHLWRTDCGTLGHALDAEHVSALVERNTGTTPDAEWKALYWYAAAHEDTVCDASQIARASTLRAESHGPELWISRGKHASFFTESLCKHGCGGDRCEAMVPAAAAAPINIGELHAPMNGATWIGAPAWPLAVKLSRTDFPDTRTTRLNQLPDTDIAWANPEKRPVQAVILGGNDALGGGATGFRSTNTALVVADAHTSNALNRATASTGHALAKTFRGVKKFLGAESPKSSAAAPQH